MALIKNRIYTIRARPFFFVVTISLIVASKMGSIVLAGILFCFLFYIISWKTSNKGGRNCSAVKLRFNGINLVILNVCENVRKSYIKILDIGNSPCVIENRYDLVPDYRLVSRCFVLAASPFPRSSSINLNTCINLPQSK